MFSKRHVFLLILLTYVSMLNVFIVSVLYKKYSDRLQPVVSPPAPPTAPRPAPTPEARGLRLAAARSAQGVSGASQSTLVLVMLPASERTSNHALAVSGTHLLTTVHQSLARHESVSYHVRLVV